MTSQKRPERSTESPRAHLQQRVLCKGGAAMNQHQQGAVSEGRAARKNNKWKNGATLLPPERNELIVGSSPKALPHFSGSQISTACLILSGFSLHVCDNPTP